MGSPGLLLWEPHPEYADQLSAAMTANTKAPDDHAIWSFQHHVAADPEALRPSLLLQTLQLLNYAPIEIYQHGSILTSMSISVIRAFFKMQLEAVFCRRPDYDRLRSCATACQNGTANKSAPLTLRFTRYALNWQPFSQ